MCAVKLSHRLPWCIQSSSQIPSGREDAGPQGRVLEVGGKNGKRRRHGIGEESVNFHKGSDVWRRVPGQDSADLASCSTSATRSPWDSGQVMEVPQVPVFPSASGSNAYVPVVLWIQWLVPGQVPAPQWRLIIIIFCLFIFGERGENYFELNYFEKSVIICLAIDHVSTPKWRSGTLIRVPGVECTPRGCRMNEHAITGERNDSSAPESLQSYY